MKISATIITFNEEQNIGPACESLAWADELVVVDSNSTDRTVEIARQYTDRVINHEFRGYKDKHEFADAQTSGNWIFWLDADERVTPELQESIKQLRQRDPGTLPNGFLIARRTKFLDRWIMHSGWYPDLKMRLYRKEGSYWDGVSPHETARIAGPVETLPGELLHYTKRDLSESHIVLDSYTTLAAEYHEKNNRRSGPLNLVVSPAAAFVRTYLLKQGFRDGVPGLIIAVMTGYGVFLRYAKLWERTRGQ
ncbi:MAG TPA: glycosyltransferase family 2 protein [Pyrinomonadaceae bacterium]|nr:glycosyltransferase family 2 protein [Pyrinomonadaceae bacterium]